MKCFGKKERGDTNISLHSVRRLRYKVCLVLLRQTINLTQHFKPMAHQTVPSHHHMGNFRVQFSLSWRKNKVQDLGITVPAPVGPTVSSAQNIFFSHIEKRFTTATQNLRFRKFDGILITSSYVLSPALSLVRPLAGRRRCISFIARNRCLC